MPIRFLLPALASALLTAAEPAHRVVFHVNLDGEARWNEVLTNVENVQKAFGPGNVAIRVVAHGNGAGLVLRSNAAVAARVQAVQAAGGAFALCANTIAKKGIGPDDIDPGVAVVDSGIAEVVRLQEQGWTYIKPGS